MEQEVNFLYNARYYKQGDNGPKKSVWFVLHGYGQLATYFIKKFSILSEMGHKVIAPEGLHRFYQLGFTGRVGASWMTREDRLRDIHNYLTYLDAVYSAEIADPSDTSINILGFSQGAATASRWVTQTDVQFDKLILWAGIFPPDMKFDLSRSRLHGKKIYLTYGTEDHFVTQEKLDEQQSLVAKLDVSPEVIIFDGGHEIDKSTLEKIARN